MSIRAIGLFSGGLDSILAFKILQEQGIDCIGVHFTTPFYKHSGIEEIAKKYSIPLIIRPVLKDYMSILTSPRHGYGKNFNPCIDCHGFMVKKAGDMLDELGAKFIFTGEVLGERPFSQTNYGLSEVGRASGYADLLLRPLSARLLPETLPERMGWVDRERLLDIKGRSRKRQLELAKRYGIDVDSSLQPAGGCLLTDPTISMRIKAYVRRFSEQDMVIYELIKTGRHFIIAKDTVVIIGRNQFENEVIERYASKGCILKTISVPGPVGILFGRLVNDVSVRTVAGRILAAYSKRIGREVDIEFCDGDVLLLKQEERGIFRKYGI